MSSGHRSFLHRQTICRCWRSPTGRRQPTHGVALAATLPEEGLDGLLRDKTRPPGVPPVPQAKVHAVVERTLRAPPGPSRIGPVAPWPSANGVRKENNGQHEPRRRLADLAFDKTSNVIVRRAEIPSTIAEARQKETKLSNAVAGTTKRMIGEERYVWSSQVRPRFGEP